jgi:hypothetical protein
VADACDHAEHAASERPKAAAKPEIGGAASSARSSVNAFWLQRDTTGVLSRVADAAAS